MSYAVDSDGHYTLASSVGWEAKNIALSQAWEAIDDQLRDVIGEIMSGEKSPLAYYMIKNQMDMALLSEYSGVARWRVKRHLKPKVFAKLNRAALTPMPNFSALRLSNCTWCRRGRFRRSPNSIDPRKRIRENRFYPSAVCSL